LRKPPVAGKCPTMGGFRLKERKRNMFDQITLPSGLRVVGERLTHVHSCTVGVWVKVGSINESAAENGLSHFIEHMVFKGTKTRTARQISEEMDMVGGQLNAFTSKECTCYYAKVMDNNLPLAVDILSDLALRPVFDQTELSKERGVVLEEIAMVEDTPDDLVHELLAEAQFDGSLSRPILGPKEQISAYSREDIISFWKKHYHAENMVVSIAGNYDWQQFLEWIGQYFKDFPNPSAGENEKKPQQFAFRKLSKVKDTEQLHICMGFPGVPAGCDKVYAISIFNNILGGGMSSRLFQRIREELGMAYSIYTYTSGYNSIGSFNLYVGTTPENGETVIREVQEQLRRWKDDPMTEKEFLSAKAQLRSGYVMGLESSSGRMQSIGRSMLLRNELKSPEEILEKIDAVTPEMVLDIAEKILCNEPCAAVVGKNADQILSLIGGEALG